MVGQDYRSEVNCVDKNFDLVSHLGYSTYHKQRKLYKKTFLLHKNTEKSPNNHYFIK